MSAYPSGTNPRDAALLRRPNFAHPDHGSIMSTDTDTPTEYVDSMLNTPAMPILPDMPTRSRKLIEDLGGSSIVGGGMRSTFNFLFNNYITIYLKLKVFVLLREIKNYKNLS